MLKELAPLFLAGALLVSPDNQRKSQEAETWKNFTGTHCVLMVWNDYNFGVRSVSQYSYPAWDDMKPEWRVIGANTGLAPDQNIVTLIGLPGEFPKVKIKLGEYGATVMWRIQGENIQMSIVDGYQPCLAYRTVLPVTRR